LLLIPGAVVTFLVENLIPPAAFGPIPILLRVETNFVLFCATVFVSLALKINNRWQESEKQKLDAELSFLKAQINPHFLFNTLNSIYTLAVKKSDLTASAIVKLSGMMRYVITEAQTEFVSLNKELLYVSNYIDLQKIRLGNTVIVEFEPTLENEDTDGQFVPIAPLVLIPFVENAFKYGVNPEEPSLIRILLTLDGQTLSLSTYNRIFAIPHTTDDTSSGLGIANVRKRLELIYPERHSLEITRTESDFTVQLSLRL
jgi:sensor histidine kinase YesM